MRVFLSREEKRRIVNVSEWDPVLGEIKTAWNVLIPETLSDLQKKKWITEQLSIQQSWRCFWCGKLMAKTGIQSPFYRTLEHVEPRAAKGKNVNTLSNLRAACRECNSSRSDWSAHKSLTLTVREQKEQIDRLRSERNDLSTILSFGCKWCSIKTWVRKKMDRRLP